MGVCGCGRVRQGTGDTGDTTTSQVGGVYGRGGQYLGAMVGEISPDIMFWQGMQKNGTNGYRWVQVDADGANGRMFNGGSKKKAKGTPNG